MIHKKPYEHTKRIKEGKLSRSLGPNQLQNLTELTILELQKMLCSFD